MWFLDTDGPIRRLAILKHEKITQKWLRALEIGAFPESRPEVKGAAHASSVLLLKLLPKEGPTCDLASIAATNVFSLTTRRSHSFVGLKKPGSSTAFFLKIYRSDIPARAMSSVKRSINPSIWAPPVTALRNPWSALPLFSCFCRWVDRLCQ